MQITTRANLAEQDILQTRSLARGNAVRTRHLGKRILALRRDLVGGEAPESTEMLAESRAQAIDRMCPQAPQARSLGADDIVAMRLSIAPLMQGAAAILVHGTAVRLRRRSPAARLSR